MLFVAIPEKVLFVADFMLTPHPTSMQLALLASALWFSKGPTNKQGIKSAFCNSGHSDRTSS
jgi:hypothetical protein